MAITSATTHNLAIKIIKKHRKSNYILKNNFLQTPSKPGVLLGKTFSHTLDEARSVGLAKACVFPKIYSVIEEIRFKNIKGVRCP